MILALQWWQADAQQQQLTQTVQRRMLKKVAQHKAHLTALTAVAPLDAAKESSALPHIAQSVQTIYPRVQEIQRVTAATPATGGCRDPAVAQTASSAGTASQRQPA